MFRDDRGVTTTGMALSLLISLALVFTGAQVYRVNSASAEVQDVADAVALCAENQVGEFMVIARFCDATVLSLSLTGIVATALGVAALCVPATAELSKGLLSTGKSLIKARDRFARKAAQALNKLQKALPYYAAACAAGVAKANDGDSSGANYLAAAVLVPIAGKEIAIPADDDASQLADEIADDADEVREKAKEAEEASEEANRSKERAFMRDCGDNPNYCMYERASKLAGLSGGSNPLYTSVDTWSFSVALSRAKEYYRARWSNEAPTGNTNDDYARSTLRSHFYHYAVKQMDAAYVHESSDSFEANFPHLPHNTEQMRMTELYTDAVYPITTVVEEVESGSESEEPEESGETEEVTHSFMHSWAGCPEAAGSVAMGSISDMENGDYEMCPTCKFTAASMGKVASASTSIDNGFEYHYEAVADEAAIYQEARHRADEPKAAVKDKAGGFLERLADLARSTADKRIEPDPPGRYGVIAFVANIGSTSAAGGFANAFVRGGGSLGPRAAISAATLVGEKSDEGRTVINSMLDGLRENGGALAGAAGIVLDAWSFLLKAYSDGQSAITEAVRGGLDSLPLVGASGLGTWASDKLKSALRGAGLQPAELLSLKAVLVNSRHVAAKDDSAFSRNFLSVKQRVVAASAGASDLFSMVLTDAEQQALERIGGVGDSMEVASIELLGEGGPSVPVTIPIPEEVKTFGVTAVRGFFERLRSLHVDTTDQRVWE